MRLSLSTNDFASLVGEVGAGPVHMSSTLILLRVSPMMLMRTTFLRVPSEGDPCGGIGTPLVAGLPTASGIQPLDFRTPEPSGEASPTKGAVILTIT